MGSVRRQFNYSIGDKVGAFTITKINGTDITCQCECGNFRTYKPSVLAPRKSCGCKTSEIISRTHTTHGKSNTQEFWIYIRAKLRCEDPKDKAYDRYGGRGIEFRFKSLDEFIQEIGLRPSKKHSLDRINNKGHYEKGNVRWATASQQQRNTRTTVMVRIGEITQSLNDWTEHYGIPHRRTYSRLKKSGWSVERAFGLPWGTGGEVIKYD